MLAPMNALTRRTTIDGLFTRRACGLALAVGLAMGPPLLTAACSGDETQPAGGSGGSGLTGTGAAGAGGTAGSGGVAQGGTGGQGGFISGDDPFPLGHIYIAGSRNAQVLEFDADLQPVSQWTHPAFGTVQAPPGQSFAEGPAGMVFDSQGYLVVAAVDQFCVFSAPGELLACHPKIQSQPTENVIFDLDGNLYTTTSTGGTNEVHKYDSSYGYVTTFSMPTGNLTGVTCDTDGNLFIASQVGGGSSAIYKVDKTDLSVLDTIDVAVTAEGLQLAADGNILMATLGSGILRVQPSSPTTVLSTITHASLHFAVPLTIDNDGLIFTADYENGDGTLPADLFVFDTVGNVVASSLPSEIYGPFGVVVAGAVLPCGAYQPPR